MTEGIKVPDYFFEKNELSLQAVGLLCFLKAYSQKHEVKKTTFYKIFPKNKKSSVSNAWMELVNEGYILQFRSRDGGKWNYSYFFNFKPFTNEEIEIIKNEISSNG